MFRKEKLASTKNKNSTNLNIFSALLNIHLYTAYTRSNEHPIPEQ